MAHELRSFGARLRAERERRKVSLASIAERTKILGALLEGLEHDDVSRWPTGLYRRAFMRAYAGAIGLDPDATVKEFLERFPDPEAPIAPVLSSGANTGSPPAVPAAPSSAMPDAFRLSAPALGAWFRAGSLLPGLRLRVLAAGVDLFIIGVFGLATFVLVGELWPLLVVGAGYYALAILLLGNTPGVSYFSDPQGVNGASRARASGAGASGADASGAAPFAPLPPLAPIRWLRRAWSAFSGDALPHPDTPSPRR